MSGTPQHSRRTRQREGHARTLQDWSTALKAAGSRVTPERGTGGFRFAPCPGCGGGTEDTGWVRPGNNALLAGCNNGCRLPDIVRELFPNGTGSDGHTMPPPDYGPSPDDEQEQAINLKALMERWSKAKPCTQHAYLEEKGYAGDDTPRELRMDGPGGNIMLIPMYRPGAKDREEVSGVQQIWKSSGSWVKRYIKGSAPTGAHFPINPRGKPRLIYLAEGLATALAIYLSVTGTDMDGTVVSCFTAGNLKPAAVALAERYPDAAFIIAADNDRVKPGKVNPGVRAAQQAAEAVGGQWCVPDIDGDFDDLYRAQGPEAVQKWLDPEQAKHVNTTPPEPSPPEPEWSDDTGPTDPDDIMPRKAKPRDQETGEPLPDWPFKEIVFTELDLPDPEWLIEDLLTTDGVSLLGGDPKVGKTTFARTVAAAVSEGKKFLRKEVKQGKVFYLAWEGSMRSHKKALVSMGANKVRGFEELPPPMYGDHDRIDFLRWVVEMFKPVLVVCDTLGRMLGVDDIKDYSATGPAMERIEAIAREFECHILLIHHARKDGGDYGAEFLGSAQIFASVDIGLSLKRSPSGRFLNIAGGREAEMDMPDTRLALDGLGRVIGDGTYDRKDPISKTGRKVVRYLDEQPGWWKVKAIAKAIDANRGTVRNQLVKLHENGQVERQGIATEGYEYTIHGDPS